MSRWFRLYEKKRGERRTGSKEVASLGEALFFGVFLVAGAIFVGVLGANLVWPEWRVNRQFAETTCVVERVVIHHEQEHDGDVVYRPDIWIQYTADGIRHRTVTYDIQRTTFPSAEVAEERAGRFLVGQEYPCWYDPLEPDRAVLVRGYSGLLYVVLLVPLSFIVIGGGGLVYTLLHWNASAERRAARVQKAAQRDMFEPEKREQPLFPAVPADANLTNSPGTALAFRLPAAVAPGLSLFVTAAACVCWNALAAMFVVMAVRAHLRHEPDWALTGFVSVCVVIGVGLVGLLVWQLLVTTGVGATRVEISHHPLLPGKSYEVLVAQAGRLSVNSLELLLACDERATYRQGTDTRTERRRVFAKTLFRRDEFEIQPGMPFEGRCQLDIPPAAMHSFKTDHNEINWKLVVRGKVAGWPDFERDFPVVVYPPAVLSAAHVASA